MGNCFTPDNRRGNLSISGINRLSAFVQYPFPFYMTNSSPFGVIKKAIQEVPDKFTG